MARRLAHDERMTARRVTDGQWRATNRDRPAGGIDVYGSPLKGIQGKVQQNELRRRVRLMRLLGLKTDLMSRDLHSCSRITI